MNSILPFQLPLRQQLPQVQGNVDYQVFRETLERISDLIRLSDTDSIVVLFCLERADREARKQAKRKGQRYKGLSHRQQRWVQKIARQALRCGVARGLVDESYRDFSCRLADSPLLQRFCLLDTLEPIRVPGKSTLERMEKMLPEKVVRGLVSRVVLQAAEESNDSGDAEALGLCDPIDMDVYFLDTTCLEANIHFPVDWVLLRDATRTLMKAVALIRKHGLKHRMQEPGVFIKEMNRLCIEMTHAGRRTDSNRQRKRILRLMKQLMKKVRRHAQMHRELLVKRRAETSLSERQAAQIVGRLEGVLGKLPEAIRQAHERIIGGVAVANADKILSMYEQDLHVIVRGKAGAKVEFGNTLLIAEQSQGLIVDWRLYRGQGPADAAAMVESLERAAVAYGGRHPKSVVTDRGFSSLESREYLAGKGIGDEMCPRSVAELRRKMQGARFREHQLRRGQTEGRIGILKNEFLGKPLRKKGYEFRALSVAWAVLAHNLWVLARLPRAAEETERIAS
jgi:IS5 family transposase